MEPLTTGLRARDPRPSPDGRTVVFVRNVVAQSRLAFVDVKTKAVVEMPPFERVSQIYNPRFAADGRRVAFSANHPGGWRDVYVVDRETQKIDRITADRFLDITPAWSPDGRWLIFSSDRDGIFNVYAHDTETGSLSQVTNVLYEFIAAYIMASQRNGTIYVGVTSDLLQRGLAHREGRIDGFTKRYGCKLLVWWEQHGDMLNAIAREKELKRFGRKQS